MLHMGCTRYRQAVAQFVMKSFRARQQILLTPETVKSVFLEKLDPKDRFLRQSSVGAGASRFLVLDKNQRVRGVYHPLICLPYPVDSTGILGISVELYVQRIEEKQQLSDGCSFVVVSHGNGLGVAVYDVGGNAQLPLVNIKLPAQRKTGVGMMNERDMRPFAETTTLVDDLAEVVEENYTKYVYPCNSFFFLSNTNTCISFQGMKRAWQEKGFAETSPLSFEDHRWVSLPDMVILSNRSTSLYCRDNEGDRVLSTKELSAGVQRGRLELDT